MSTKHIEANEKDISNVVLMPGDPKRVQYIVDKYLYDVKLVNSARGELGYTGYYKEKRVTLFSSGMGIPSMGIYSYELFNNYNVDYIIRIGSCGSYNANIKVNELFLVDSCFTTSSYAQELNGGNDKIVYSSNFLNDIILQKANESSINLLHGRCFSTESFYTETFDINVIHDEYKCDCVEMETFSLFYNAYALNKKASCLLTVSDNLITGDALSIKEREESFDKMIQLALDSCLKL